MDNEEYHDIVRRLTAMMAEQHEFNGRVSLAIENHAGFMARLNVAIEDIGKAIQGNNATLAQVKTLIARMITQSENGRNA